MNTLTGSLCSPSRIKSLIYSETKKAVSVSQNFMLQGVIIIEHIVRIRGYVIVYRSSFNCLRYDYFKLCGRRRFLGSRNSWYLGECRVLPKLSERNTCVSWENLFRSWITVSQLYCGNGDRISTELNKLRISLDDMEYSNSVTALCSSVSQQTVYNKVRIVHDSITKKGPQI